MDSVNSEAKRQRRQKGHDRPNRPSNGHHDNYLKPTSHSSSSAPLTLLLCLSSIVHCSGFSYQRLAVTSFRNEAKRASSLLKVQDENDLFFAQDQQQHGMVDDEENDLFYAQQQPLAEASGKIGNGGMNAYDAQFSAFASPSADGATQEMEARNGSRDEPSSSYTDDGTQPSRQSPRQEIKSSSAVNPSSRPISNVDARVLESILQEGKLDLSTEQEVKRLLEGPRLNDEETVGRSTDDGEYSSQFVTKISDNKFWNSLKAKTSKILESVQIYIENRIERDTQTLAAVGLFTFDRIRKDVSRALPAAGRQVKKLLLASNSTYVEKIVQVTEKTVLALPSERTAQSIDSYEELTTPADEIKQVTEAIRDILAGKDVVLSSSSSNRRRGVKSLAPAGTARLAQRQQRAYQARKKTVLQREKEGIDRTLGRAIGSVSDATWELRQEMNSGVGREAGYRSRGVRRALASGAVRLLEAGREGGRRLLSGSGTGNANLLDGDNVNIDRGVNAKSANVEILEVNPIQEEEIINEMIQETNLEYAPDGLLSPQSFIEEKSRLITSLESCLSQPGQTWLTKEVVTQATQSGIGLDGSVLRQVITAMVTLRDELKEEIIEEDDGEYAYLKVDYVQNELRRMKQMVDNVTSLAASAAGNGAATLLKTELEGFVLSDSLDEIIEIELERLEQMLAEMVAEREREIQSKSRDDEVASPAVVEVFEPEQVQISQSATRGGRQMYTEVEVEPGSTIDRQTFQPNDGQDDQYTGSTTVEVVSDQEYLEYEQQFRTVQSSDLIDDDEEIKQGDNPVAKFVLRVVDAIFFVGEKFFLVGLPSMITTGSNVSFRYSQAQNRGSGSVGWQPLKNLKQKKNQY